MTNATASATHEGPLPYRAGGREYRGLLLADAARSEPAATDVTAAVVLLPDWRGQSALARAHAAGLVARGCAVAIADLYGGGFSPTDPDEVGPLVARLVAHRAEGVTALAACVAALRARVAAGTPVVCVGYSAGGMVALDYARSGADVAGLVLCSALLKTAKPAGEAPGRTGHPRAPVLILQGTRDVVSPLSVVAAVAEELDVAGAAFRVELYGGARHGFENPEAGSDPAARLMYSPDAARRAQQAIAEFVAEVGRGAR